MNRLIFILIIFCFGGLSLNGQELSSREKEALDSVGLFYQTKAFDIYNQSHDHDSSIFYINKSLSFFQKSQNWNQVVNCFIVNSSLYNYKGDYILFDSLLHHARRIADEKKIGNESPPYQAILNSYGSKHLEMGNYDLAIENFQKVLKSDRKSGNLLAIASVLNNLGDAFFGKGDYEQALIFFQESRQNRFDTHGNNWRVAKTDVSIGNTFRKKNNPTEALKYYNNAIKISHQLLREDSKLKDSENIIPSLTNAYLNLAEMALENKNWKEAQEKVSLAKHYRKNTYVTDQGRANDILGTLNLQQGNFKTALNHFYKSHKDVLQEFDLYEKHPIVAEKELKIAEVLKAIGDWETALTHYHQALILVTHDFNSPDTQENPSLEKIYSKVIALTALEGKAECFYQFYKNDNRFSNLEIAYKTFQFALKVIPALRQDFQKQGSKELLSPKTLPLFENAIHLAISLHSHTNDPKYLEDAFSYVENNKAILLLESINEIEAKKTSGIPDSLLKNEKELNSQISYFEKLDNEETQKISIDDAYRNRLRKKLFQLNEEKQTLIHLFEKEFPKYHELKYNTDLAKINDVKKLLKNNSTVLIEFFVGYKNIYVFTITHQDVKIDKFEKEASFEKNIEDFRTLISQPPNTQNINSAYNQYAFLAQKLFQKLIKKSFTKNIKSLIIIPDDVLCLLPFELLLMDAPTDSTPSYHLENLEYLIEHVDISYGSSSTLLLNKLEKNIAESDLPFSGYAPSFNDSYQSSTVRTCQPNELYSLDHSQNEVIQIQKIWGGEIFLGKDATLSTFKAYAPKSDIIHLATHACVDDKNHHFNTIHFADKSLSNNDLFHFAFQSRLAVLSACNTGTGHLVKGEGVMSLSRGFIQAGCPSVVMSLWSVDDGTTSEIMERFYQHLKSGESKNQALRLAKLDYLRTASKAKQHPFYWATFVQFGDPRPLVHDSYFSLKNILLAIFTLLMFFVLSRFFRKN